MSDASQGEGWWIASDGKWYPPESHPDAQAPAPPAYEPPHQQGYQAPPQPVYEPPPAPGYQPPQAPPNQPYQQQPGMPPPPTQPSLDVMKPKRPWWKIALVVVVLGILLIGGCTAVVLRAVSGPIDAANDFLADIAAQDFSAAVEHLDPSCFGGAPSAAVLESEFGRGLESYNLTSVRNDNNTSGSASGTITRADFGTQPISFAMTKPFDDWLVCGVQFGDS